MPFSLSRSKLKVKLTFKNAGFIALGIAPVFSEKAQAVNYAENRATFRSGEIRILDSTGNVERTIQFTEADRKL